MIFRRRPSKKQHVLAFLRENPGMHYTEEIAAGAGIRFGSHHPTLASLEKDGLIKSGWFDRSVGGPRRRGYWIS